MKLNSHTALVVVDVQRAFDDSKWGARNNPTAEQHIGTLIKAWRSQGLIVVHVRHQNPSEQSSFNPTQPGFQFKPEAMPEGDEPVFTKCVNSAFIGTELEAHLRAHKISQVVIVGITTDHCVSTTTRMAGNLGFDAYIVSDATATFERFGPDGRHWSAEMMHDTALASLHMEFATVVTTADVFKAIALWEVEAS